MSLQNIEDAYPLTSIQAGMLYHCLESSESDVYVSYIAIDLSGPVDANRLRASWQSVVNRHGSLRASYQWEGLDEPLVVIRQDTDITWALHDWSALDSVTSSERFEQLQQSERQSSISVSAQSLQRFNLVRLSAVHWKLLWSIHHLLADGWSTPVIINEVMRCYDNDGVAPADLPRPFNFSKYVAWLDQCDMAAADRHWSDYLGAARATPVNLTRPQADANTVNFRGQNASNESTPKETAPEVTTGAKESEPVQTERFQRIDHDLSVPATDMLNQFCRDAGVTLSTVMHGLWAIVLQQYCGKPDVVFCTTSSGRQCGLDGMDTAVGLFLNSLPLAVKLEPALDLRDWLQNLQQQIQRNVRFDYTPLSNALDHLSDDSDKSIESIVVMEGHNNDWAVKSADGAIELANITYVTHSNFPLAVLVYPGASLSVSVVFDSLRFSDTQVASLTGALMKLTELLTGAKVISVGDLARSFRMSVFSSHSQRYHGPVLDSGSQHSVSSWLDSICQHNADTIALVETDGSVERSITYNALCRKSSQIANLLREKCDSDAQFVGVYCERGIDQIAAFYGVMKAGFAYIPLDPAYPEERTRLICADSSASLVLCGDTVSTPEYIPGIRISDADAYPQSFANPPAVASSSAAYLMYTSGSTGRPRGVVVTHGNLIHSTQARLGYYNLAGDCFILLSSCSFDSSVAGIYGTLCSAGTLVLPEQGQEKDVEAIADLVQRYQVTQTLCLPGLYRLMLQSNAHAKLTSLNKVIVAGESCSADLVRLHRSVLPSAALFNEYGPTEATVWSSVCQIDTPDQEQTNAVPIGEPIGDTSLFALDGNGNPCVPGVEGQLVVCGPGVAAGYYNDEDRTRECFVNLNSQLAELKDDQRSDPVCSQGYLTGDLGYLGYDGLFRFTGRLDRQIKVRGYRIEPSEIEAAMISSGALGGDVLVTMSKIVPMVDSMSTEELRAAVEKQLESIDGRVARELIESVKSSSCITVERD